MMERHVNGWPAIEQQLVRLNRKQVDLARLLGMTPAAISLVKKGSFLLNPRQLEEIAAFLKFDDGVLNEFYTELFNARLISREELPVSDSPPFRVSRGFEAGVKECCAEVPMADIGMLAGYESALEPLSQFLRRNSPDRLENAVTGDDVCVLRVSVEESGIGLPAGSLITIDAGRYPETASLNLIALRDGRILLREFLEDGDRIYFRSKMAGSGQDLIWRRREAPGLVQWIHPVLEIVMKMRV